MFDGFACGSPAMVPAGQRSIPSGATDIVVGVDIGSTTVKTVVVDAQTKRILDSQYARHGSRQALALREQLARVVDLFPSDVVRQARIFATGSGAAPLLAPLQARFVQEVNAAITAIDMLHPDVGSLVELGGQDAKIVVFKETAQPGERRAIASMNDKCASGTGATIDKCVAKLGLTNDALAALAWNPDKLHPVAAKCGVFAETDIVNLLKSGVPAEEIACSLLDAIVQQNLSVLTRGNTMRPRVLLLGGPNVYLPALRDCWRQRIAESWRERGIVADGPLDRLVFSPDHAQFYPALGAALFGLAEPGEATRFAGLAGLDAYLASGRRSDLQERAGPPLVTSRAERDAFAARYATPPFEPARLQRGQTVEAFIGIDGGSTSSKAVLMDADGRVLQKAYLLSEGNPIADARTLTARLSGFVEGQGARVKVLGVGATGYAADILDETIGVDANVVETVAHMTSAVHYFGDVDVICDVGGQDIKVLFMANGQMKDFRLSNQCSAGNGALLQAMAAQFGVPIEDYAQTAFDAELTPKFSYGCAVFLDADRVTFQKEGFSREEIMAGLARVLPQNIWQYIVQIPRLSALGSKFVLQGGVQYNLAAVKAQVDYIGERAPEAAVHVHPHCGEAGAIGAALEARRVIARRRDTRFIGLHAAANIAYTTKNDDSTVCRFCTNEWGRTFIDARTPDGRTSRYIAGFSCENGTVESKDELKKIALRRKALKLRFPNLVEEEAQLAFLFSDAKPLPAAVAAQPRSALSKLFGRTTMDAARPFARSSDDAGARRSRLRVGIPRVLNLYSTGPMWRTYFETLGLRPENVVFSDHTNEEMVKDGLRLGSVDPCFPAKIALAHVHSLLTEKHDKAPLDFVFFPALTHIPSFAENVVDTACCTIVAGSPAVVKSAFAKEKDWFAEKRLDLVAPVLSLKDRDYFRHQMFSAWGERLGMTRDENAFACDAALSALDGYDARLQARGEKLIAKLEADNAIGLLLLARPYHADPGVNHDVLEEFQALGYPVLSIRSIPKRADWLNPFFAADLAKGRIKSALDITDVWPECYSVNSTEKVWGAKFAARHPNLAVLDLSSFKCGHDAPAYGLIDKILGASATPYLALHDIDANKPGGSIAIRVKTFVHTLRLCAERLQDEAELQARRDPRELAVSIGGDAA